MPERAFDEDAFLEDVQRIHEKKGGVVVVASEGLKTKDGTPIVGNAYFLQWAGQHIMEM